MMEYVNASDFQEFNIDLRSITKSTMHKKAYYNYPVSFDIETSSFIENGQQRAIMYIWQMCLGDGDLVVVGRTWSEWLSFIHKLRKYFHIKKDLVLVIYCHNLSYEFQWIQGLFEWEKIFALDERAPLYARTTFGIEFRCSYRLSGYKLETLAKNLTKHNIKKLVGDLDYKKVRHSLTPITPDEMNYNINDVLIVCAYISECLEKAGGNITKIPLTKTGYVRKACQIACYGTDHSAPQYYNYRKLMKKLTIEPKEYAHLKSAFAGGFTHANAFYVNQTLEDITSYDFTSSYPYVLFANEFPWSKGELVHPTFEEVINNINTFAWIIDLEFYGLESVILQDDYISKSKCLKVNYASVNNGRINSAEYVRLCITNVDLLIIMKSYRYKSVKVISAYRYYKAYLPTPFIKEMLSYYVGKTKLKGVSGKEEEYLYNKEQLNSFYGMIVTSPVRPNITYENNTWGEQLIDLEDGVKKYNNNVNRFMFYPVGVFVTAYARYNLWTGIFDAGNDYVYSDTDSIKLMNYEAHKPYFERYNNFVYTALEKACSHHNIPLSDAMPKTIKGIEKPLGVWDYDGHYKRFKTLGAKRYLYEYDDGSLSLTVSGLNKKVAIPYLLDHYTKDKIFEMFSCDENGDADFIIPKGFSGRMVSTYIDEPTNGKVKDYLGKTIPYCEKTSIHLGDATYTLSLSKEYIKFLLKIKNEIE